MSTTASHYYFEEWLDFPLSSGKLWGWCACGYGYKWTLDQCREQAMHRKIVSPRSRLRIVKETREVWTWREREKTK